MKQVIDRVKEMKAQLEQYINQAKSIGSKLSLDALKGVLQGQLQSALNGLASVSVSQGMKNAGLTEDTLKDPEKTATKIQEINEGQKGSEYDMDKVQKCWEARDSMLQQMTTLNIANSFAAQMGIAEGEGMKKVQEANADSDDLMQINQGRTAALQEMYKQMSTTTQMNASKLAREALSKMCD